MKLQDLEDKTRAVNLSDKKFNRFVTRDNDNYSHITYKLADVKKGVIHFRRKYGVEAAKLFTAMHGENVYSEQGVRGRFREGQKTANIYFQNQSVTEVGLTGQEEGTKVLRGAYLGRRDGGSFVGLGNGFDVGSARVSGVVRKSGEAGETLQGIDYTHIATTMGRDNFDPEQLSNALKDVGARNIALTLAAYHRK